MHNQGRYDAAFSFVQLSLIDAFGHILALSFFVVSSILQFADKLYFVRELAAVPSVHLLIEFRVRFSLMLAIAGVLNIQDSIRVFSDYICADNFSRVPDNPAFAAILLA